MLFSNRGVRGSIEVVDTLRKVFYPASREKGDILQESLEKKSENEGELVRGGSSSSETIMDKTSATGRMREDIDSNTQLAVENRKMLVRIDERTAWIARLLVGTFMAILGAVYLTGGI